MSGEPQIKIEGNLGSDVERRVTPQGKEVASFSVAVTPRVQRDAEWVDGETVWFKCVAWGRKAQSLTGIPKGTPVLIAGDLSYPKWTDKDGNERHSLEVTVRELGIVPKVRTEESNNVTDW